MLDTDKETQILDLFQDVKPLSDYVSNGFKKVKRSMSQLSSTTDGLPDTFIKVQLNQLHEHDFNEEVYPSQADNETVRQVMESILTNGFDGVITCTKRGTDRYIIVSGHIRYRALSQLVKEGHTQFNEVMVYLKEFKSIQEEKMYILDMNNAKRSLNDIHQFKSIGIYLELYRSNPDSDSSKRSEIQFLCDKLNLSERQIYKYLSIYKYYEGNVEKSIQEINKHGSVNKTVQFLEKEKLGSKPSFVKKNTIKSIRDMRIDKNILVPPARNIDIDLREDIIMDYVRFINQNLPLLCAEYTGNINDCNREDIELMQKFMARYLYDIRELIDGVLPIIYANQRRIGESNVDAEQERVRAKMMDTVKVVHSIYFPEDEDDVDDDSNEV